MQQSLDGRNAIFTSGLITAFKSTTNKYYKASDVAKLKNENYFKITHVFWAITFGDNLENVLITVATTKSSTMLGSIKVDNIPAKEFQGFKNPFWLTKKKLLEEHTEISHKIEDLPSGFKKSSTEKVLTAEDIRNRCFRELEDSWNILKNQDYIKTPNIWQEILSFESKEQNFLKPQIITSYYSIEDSSAWKTIQLKDHVEELKKQMNEGEAKKNPFKNFKILKNILTEGDMSAIENGFLGSQSDNFASDIVYELI
jgi:hypothetical protein